MGVGRHSRWKEQKTQVAQGWRGEDTQEGALGQIGDFFKHHAKEL